MVLPLLYVIYIELRGRLRPFYVGVGGWLLYLFFTFKFTPSYTDIFRYIDGAIRIEIIGF